MFGTGMRFDPRGLLGQDRGSVLGKNDLPKFTSKVRMMAGRPGPIGKGGGAPSPDPNSVAGLSAQITALAKIVTESRLSQVPIGIYFYGGLLSSGKDPNAPPGDTGSNPFVNSIPFLSNNTGLANTIPASTAVELVRVGQGLNPNQAYPTTSTNNITLPANWPTLQLTYLYPGIVVGIDFSFTTLTEIGKDVIVGSALGIDSEQLLYTPYPGYSRNIADDFDTYEHHFLHQNTGSGPQGGVQLWDDYGKQYGIFSPWNLAWQRNCRCLINSFQLVDTITMREWDVNMVWHPNTKQLTDLVKLFGDYPTTLKSPAGGGAFY